MFWDIHAHVVREWLRTFESLCDFLGITINPDKTEGLLQTLGFLGLIIDTLMPSLSLPEAKGMRYLGNIVTLLLHSEPFMDRLAKVAGQIVHMASIHPHGWAHVQPLWDVLYDEPVEWTGRKLKQAMFTISNPLWDCLLWWEETLRSPLSRRLWVVENDNLQLWDFTTALTDHRKPLTITTGASSLGWGASCRVNTAAGTWSEHQ